MTRASLLHVLDHATAIGPDEVRELEQLALAFPYCQTAHLLLAKAAHDQGTMLAGQRLRRAATYAADRALLRRLIEQVPEVAEQPEAELAPVAAAVPAQPTEPAAAEVVPAVEPAAPEPPVTTTPVADLPVQPAPMPPAVAAPAMAILPPPVVALVEAAPVVPAPTPEAVAPAVEPVIPPIVEPAIAGPEPIAAATSEPVAVVAAPAPVVAEPAAAPEETLPNTAPTPEPALTAATPETEPAPPVVAPPALVVEPAATEAAETVIPPEAPPIRPPDEVGIARFEFGLQEEPKPAVPVYELPGLVDEWAAAATTLTLGGDELLSQEPAATLPAPQWSEAAFSGDAAVGYSLGEGSRLGFGLGLLEAVLLAKMDAVEAESSTAEAVAAPAAATLPPTETFFEPDALLLAHWEAHRPVAPPTPSSLDLINNFLRRQPRLTRPAMLPPTPAAQADLSTRSTRTEPDLASESLARILVRQGKTARAIEIYERLMVKQPEKMAYFAAQIQQLQPPA